MANPIDTKTISKLAEILDKNQLTGLKYEDENCKISLSRELNGNFVPTYAPAPIPATPVVPSPSSPAEDVKEEN